MKQHKMRKLAPYLALKGEKNYFRYLLFCCLNRIGDSIDALAYSWIAYQLTGNAAWLAAIAGINMLPTIFLTPLIAPIVEKWPKKPVMIAATLLRGALVGLTGLLMLCGVLTAWHLAGITLLISTVESLSDPAFMACAPLIIPREKLDTAISLRSMLSQGCQLLGSALGGIVLGLLGGAWALAADGFLFFFAALPLCALRLSGASGAAGGAQPAQESYLSALRGGVSVFFKNAGLVALCFSGIFFNMFVGPLSQMEAACVVEILHLDAFALSVSGVACSVGMLLGSAIYPLLSDRFTVRRTFMCATLSLSGCYWGLIALGAVPYALLRYAGMGLLYLLLMGCVSFFSLMTNVLFYKVVPPHYMARMASIFNALTCLGSPLASIFGGTFAGLLPLSAVFALCGALALLGTLALSRLRVLDSMEESRRAASNSTTVSNTP